MLKHDSESCKSQPAATNRDRGGPTSFLYMATRFLPNVHVRTKMYKNVQKCTKYVFFLFGSSLDRFTCCG